jgi:DNA-binding transcriptional regulator YdaS (Cro superfamily)
MNNPIQKTVKDNPVQRAVKIVGSQAELARRCDVKQQSVWKWLKKGLVPAARVASVVKAVKGELSPEELCPTVSEIISISHQSKSKYNT